MLIHKNTARTRGFTLTEAAIVLGIVGLILGAIWSAAGAVFRNQRVGQTSQQVIQIVQAIRTLHASSPTLDTSTTMTQLIQAGAIPHDMVNTAGNATTNLWGGPVTFDPSKTCGTGAVAGNCFVLTFGNVPSDACIDLLSRNAGPGHDSGLFNAGVGNGSGTEVSNSVSGNVANVGTAATACGSSGIKSVFFTFMLKG